jgi:hypothetical protein
MVEIMAVLEDKLRQFDKPIGARQTRHPSQIQTLI